MKFSKHQKEIIRRINAGEIYDIFTYLKSFNLGKKVKYDKDQIIHNFSIDTIPKVYYYPKNLSPKYSNILIETDYINKLSQEIIDPANYNCFTLELDNNQGIKHESWCGNTYEINFYDGIYIANSFDNIIEFLSIWQYLKSEMLVLDVPNESTVETLSLFYVKQPITSTNTRPNSLEEFIKRINFENLKLDEIYFINDDIYSLAYENCIICKEYFERRIYPTPKLCIFIQKGYKTAEERTQSRALFTAWLAILITIILSFIPHFQKTNDTYLKEIKLEIEDIHRSIETNSYDNITSRLDKIIEQLQTINSGQAEAPKNK